MASPVKLHLYDLSNGICRKLSQELIGKQIDGIWHTSVVVFGKEVFYGQGINVAQPGQSHHGKPEEVIDMGETSLDEKAFNRYLAQVKEHYTVDKFHLLDFNCNAFTEGCVQFLTGKSIPTFVKGAILRPTIDAMYSRPAPGSTPTFPPSISNRMPNGNLVESILQGIVSQTQIPTSSPMPSFSGTSTPLGTGQSLITSTPRTPGSFSSIPTTPASLSPSQLPPTSTYESTNPSAFNHLLRTHHIVVAFFKSAKCPLCTMMEPVFENLAERKGSKSSGKEKDAVFTIVDMVAGGSIVNAWSVKVTPTFNFFLDGKKMHTLESPDASELTAQVDSLLFQAYPPHPHELLSLPAIESIPLDPILFTQVPNLDAVLNKLNAFIDSAPSWPTSSPHTKPKMKQILAVKALPKASFSWF